jgi:LPS export ABC transporter protein LptC
MQVATMAMVYGSEETTSGTAHHAASGGAARARAAVAAARARLRAFRVARRHTWAVRALKLLLPLTAVAAFAGYGLLLRGSVAIGPGTLSVGKVEVTADDLKMKNLTYFGVTKDGGKYDVRAKEAAVDFAQTGPVRLDYIEGDLKQATGVVTRLKSRRGLLDNKKGEMELLDGVEIVASNGLAARLRSAKVFNKEHRVVSQQPVVATMPAGQIEANSMDLETRARRGVFSGNVRVRLTQSEGGGKASLGLGREAKGPVDVRSQRLDMDDTARVASFSGGVTAQQGETTLRASALKVLYEGRTALPDGSGVAVAAAGGDAARVTRLAATGNVVVVAGADRKITSDAVVFTLLEVPE